MQTSLQLRARTSLAPRSVRQLTFSIRSGQYNVRTQGPLRSICFADMPMGRPNRLTVVAFRDANERKAASSSSSARSISVSEHVPIAVDYYRLLQVPRVSRPDAIRQAYENLVKQPPATAYSADTLFARAVLLKAAAESLIDPDLRRSYDAKLAAGHSSLRVSQQDLSGVLVVLQEIGEFQLVLDHGCKWLELNGSQPDAGDVAAAVALAYCDRAGQRLAAPSNKGAVLPACDDLDAALVKLRQYGMAKQLQTQILGALRDLAPEYACELVALPLGPDTAPRRAKGVALMRGVLRSAAVAAANGGSSTSLDGGLLGPDADPQSLVSHARRMLQRGRDALTCGEQVALLPDALRGSGTTPHPDVLYDGALACIVDGYRNGWPHSVHQADVLLQQLESYVRRQTAVQQERQHDDLAVAAAARRMDYSGSNDAAAETMPGVLHNDEGLLGNDAAHGGTIALERAVCAVLLGDYKGAAELLGLTDTLGSGPDESGQNLSLPTAEAQLRSFVMEHAPPGTKDMRPGLSALATKWLDGVALHSFRDTVGQPAMPLDTYWFADPRVATYLQIWSISRSHDRVLAAAHFLCNLLPNLLKFFSMIATKAAMVLALAASRTQRVVVAIGSVTLAALSASPPRASSNVTTHHRAASAHQQLGAALASPARTPAAMLASSRDLPVEAVVTTVAASNAAPEEPPAAPPPSPFGHPYGKTLRSGSNVPSLTPSVRGGYAEVEVAASRAPTPRVPGASAAAPPAVSSPTAGLRGAEATAAATTTATTTYSSELRRRFAAGTTVEASEALRKPRGPPSRLSPHDGEDDEHHADDAALLDDGNIDLSSASMLRRGMTEQDLRTHLAGLEAAMWDSELPSRALSPQRLVFLAICAMASLGALFLFMMRRSYGGGMAVVSRTTAPVPAVVSITAPTFVPPC